MIWLTWRLQRFETALATVALAAGAAVLLLTGSALLSSFDQLGIPACLNGAGDRVACTNAISAFTDQATSAQQMLTWLAFVPTLLGVLLAAPLILELEDRSYQLAWTQTVTRRRWTLARIGLPAAAGILGTAVIAGLGSWWMQPIDRVVGPLEPGSFDLQGIVPIAYMFLAFSITTCAGVLLKRTLPALGLGVTAAVAIHLAMQQVLRYRLVAPITAIWSSGPAPFKPQDWLLTGGRTASYTYVDAAGRRLSLDQVNALCGSVTGQTKDAWSSCLQAHKLGELIQYQPPERFWPLQSIESGLIVIVAAALLGVAVWWLTRRIA